MSIGDNFGAAVSMSSDGLTVVVGSPGANSGAGAAYIFGYDPTSASWSFTAELNPGTTPSPGDQFGAEVAISRDGSTAIAGAPGTSPSNAGACYGFNNIQGAWAFTADLVPTTAPASGNKYGSAVALNFDGSIAVVGAPGVNSNAGAAYGFTWDGTTWNYGNNLTPSSAPIADDLFGSSMAVSSSGTIAVVGAPGTQTNVGSAYYFEYNAGLWGPGASSAAQLTPSASLSNYDNFGASISMDEQGVNVLVGAPSDPTYGSNDGVVYAFVWDVDTNTWDPAGVLDPSSLIQNYEEYGTSVVVSGNGAYAVAGGVSTNSDPGVVVVFFWDQTIPGWSAQTQLVPDSGDIPGSGEFCGMAVATDEDGAEVVVGCPVGASPGYGFSYYQ